MCTLRTEITVAITVVLINDVQPVNGVAARLVLMDSAPIAS